MKQTAVEWLVTRIAHGGLVGKKQFDELVEQAKAMEKEQLYKFYMQGGVDAIMEADRNVEQYYNETYKQ